MTEPIGEVSLKGIVGKPVCVQLMQLQVQFAQDVYQQKIFSPLFLQFVRNSTKHFFFC